MRNVSNIRHTNSSTKNSLRASETVSLYHATSAIIILPFSEERSFALAINVSRRWRSCSVGTYAIGYVLRNDDNLWSSEPILHNATADIHLCCAANTCRQNVNPSKYQTVCWRPAVSVYVKFGERYEGWYEIFFPEEATLVVASCHVILVQASRLLTQSYP